MQKKFLLVLAISSAISAATTAPTQESSPAAPSPYTLLDDHFARESKGRSSPSSASTVTTPSIPATPKTPSPEPSKIFSWQMMNRLVPLAQRFFVEHPQTIELWLAKQSAEDQQTYNEWRKTLNLPAWVPPQPVTVTIAIPPAVPSSMNIAEAENKEKAAKAAVYAAHSASYRGLDDEECRIL